MNRVIARLVETESGCLVWPGAVTPGGYGAVRVDGVRWRVHRYVWTVLRGPIPEGLIVRHSCDTPLCANVDHLSLGTQQDNVNDMWGRGRRERKAACPQGHTYPENLLPKGSCAECQRRYAREWAARRRAKDRALRSVEG